MFRSIRMVAWTMTAIAILPAYLSHNVRGQATESNDVRNGVTVAERLEAERYEQILRSRPQMGSAFDKLYDFHLRQGTIAELCAKLELAAGNGDDGKLFQLLGLLQLRRGNFDVAAASLTRAESLLPNEPLASLYRSRALMLNRQYATALDAMKNAAERKPSQAVAIEILKDVKQFKNRAIDVEAAIALLSQLEQQFATSPQVIETLAVCLLELGRPEAARPVFEKLIALTRDPLRRIELRIQLAELKKRLGEPEQSLIELEQLVGQVKPQSWLHTSLLEKIEQLTEELHGNDGLIEYYERILLEHPGDFASLLRFVEVLRNRSRFEEAETWISKAIEAAPTRPDLLLAMVGLMEETQQIGRALDVMQRLVQLDPSNPDYIVRWGELAAIEPKTETAIRQSNAAAIWRRLLTGHENDPTKMIQIADLLRTVSLSNDAVMLYEQAVQLSEGNIEFRELLGDYLIQLDRREDARKVLTSATAAVGDSRESLIRLSEVLARFKFRDEALATLEQACEHRAEFDDLIQLAAMLTESDRVDAALATLDRAIGLAVGSSQYSTVWDAQASLYKRATDLPERIVALTKRIDETASMDLLQQLAIMQAANNQRAQAATTALNSAGAKPDSLRAWWLTVRLQREAGLSLREIESLEVLCKLDARQMAEYLQRIAAIQFQLNQFDDAMATAERVLALPNVNLQHFQTAVSFCLQAKRDEQAVSILRRATQIFPKDRSAWLMLARQLAELHHNSQSTDATWRVLELSRDQSQQREAIELLVTHNPGESGIQILLESLRKFGAEHDRERDADLWSAWMLLGSGGHATSEWIAKLLNRSNPETELLRAAMELTLRDHEYSQAIAIQKRLCRAESTVANQLKLGELLWLNGDTQASATQWKDVARYRTNDAQVTKFAKDLIDKTNWQMAADLIDIGVESGVESWEFLALGIHANIQSKNLNKAADLAGQLLAMDVPHDELASMESGSDDQNRILPATALDRLTWLEHAGVWQSILNVADATRAGYRTSQSNPRASQAAAVRHLAIQRGAALRSTATSRFNVQCFAEARALAVLAKFGKLNQQRTEDAGDAWKIFVAEAIASKDVGRLWDCVLVMEPVSAREISLTTSGAIQDNVANNGTNLRYIEILDALVSLGEPAAVELAISHLVLMRQLQHQLADRLLQTVPAMGAKELSRLTQLVEQVEGKQVDVALAARVTLAVELLRLQPESEGFQVLGNALSAETDISKLANCARQFLSNDRMTQQATLKILLRAFELELETGSESNDLAFAVSAFRSVTRNSDPHSRELLLEMFRLQAKFVERLSADLIFSDSRSNESRRAFRNYRKTVPVTADRSTLLSSSLKSALIDSTADDLTHFVATVNPGDSLTQAELTVRWFGTSVAQSILNDFKGAIVSLGKAKEQGIATEIVSLFEVWLLVANERLDEAISIVSRIEAPNEAILRECELWNMEIGSKLGNREDALRAARVLARLPLSVQESTDVATVLNRK